MPLLASRRVRYLPAIILQHEHLPPQQGRPARSRAILLPSQF